MIRRSTPTYYDPEEEVPKSNPPYLATFLKKKAPNLKALSLYIETDEPFQINVDAFEGHTPTISSLYLIRFSWSWSAPLFSPSLTSLILYGPVMWGNKCVKTLQHLPLLHHLQLTDTDALRREDRGIIVPIHHSPSVKLEHLKTLELKGGRVDVTKLSLELDIPLSTTIFLTSPHVFAIPKDDDTCPEFESLFSFASRWIERRQRKRIFPRVLHVKSDIPNYAMGLTFHLWGPRVRITSTRGLFRIADTAPSFQLRLDAHYPAPLLKRRDRCTFYPGWMLRRVIPHLPLTEVHTLYLEQLPSMVDSRTAFEGLSGVHTLCVYDYQECIFRDLITGLPNDKDSHKGHSEQEDVLFPALNTVILLNTYARGRVLEFVAERARLNHAVSTLRLVDHSPVSDQWLEELRQHVANVVWDSNKVEVLKLVDSDDDLSTYSESREEE
ncbi:hypothetical protein NLI96_g928 [Meripilus lineatus]|uniref:Uncharacterized protein n=1 Tax=Meripilus lineatus TaxID=2056292 RepID=A0AAD5VBD9_9APHY|nr:hypothetical protein NLI96_g928 [Physisporinus lineatus]